MTNLDKVILENYNKKGLIISDTDVKLASDRLIGFVDLLTKIKQRRDEELKASQSHNSTENSIFEEI
jgi:hypothetical protein